MQKGIGLCLSGGGFRASFYHIGILAQMAEQGLLRHVEVISTVSGGSIVGVAYYILLKKLIESKTDSEISQQDYIDIVVELEKLFKSGVQKNIRMRTFLDPFANVRMCMKNFSRSDQIGRLYLKYFYLPLYNLNKSAGEFSTSLNMTDLHIHPKDMQDFHPYSGNNTNKSRRNKVPILVINATSLNTGHNWAFTGAGMGEIPPRNNVFYDIDKKDRYLITPYADITTRVDKGFPVGAAVAASAGVPGLFPPMAVSNLYANRTIQLVDGGVFDNQGIAGALTALDVKQDCDVFIVSDASGQGEASANPSPKPFSVLGTVTGILTSRVREEMVNSLIEQSKENVVFAHLTRGLFANIELANNKGEESDQENDVQHGVVDSLSDFQVAQNNQLLLSKIRTDLDAFSDTEIFALEKDGFLMSYKSLVQLKSTLEQVPEKSIAGLWQFNAIQQRLRDKNDVDLTLQLSVGQHKFFRTFRQNFMLSLVVHLPLILFFCVFVLGIYFIINTQFAIQWQDVKQMTLANLMLGIGPLLLVYAIYWLAEKIVGSEVTWLIKIMRAPFQLVYIIAMHIVLPFLVTFPIWIYLQTVNRLFLKLGEVKSTEVKQDELKRV